MKLARALIIFMRYPEPGRVKSRLAAAVGQENAFGIYDRLMRRTLGVVSDYKRENADVDIFIFHDPPEKRSDLEAVYSGPWRFLPQAGTHLGDKMDRSLRTIFSHGYQHVLLIGTDLADLESGDFDEAYESLEKGFAALGPAADGGFYLIGLDRPCTAAFAAQSWGSTDVFQRTKRTLSRSGIRVKEVKTRRDIDRPEDISFFNSRALLREDLSVIIPTLRSIEDKGLLLNYLKARLWPGDEIIIAHPVGVEKKHSDNGGRVRFTYSAMGRGHQLNAGASIARGGILLFLHDDSLPPTHFAYSVRKILEAPHMSMGCFQLAFAPSTSALDLISGWANLRTRWFKLPYGDQGLFCRRETFDKLGGFKRPLLMEDVEFVERGRRLGDLMIVPEKLYTSPKRYLQKGMLRASLQNHLVMLMYRLGVEDRKLYSMYYR